MNRGISRKYRENKALAPDFIELDERTILDMMHATLELAQNIKYYDQNNRANGNWESFLLNNRLFVMAKIIQNGTTEIEKIKLDNDVLKKGLNDEKESVASKTQFSDNFLKLVKKVHDWNDLVNPSGYSTLLSSEITDLMDSIKDSLHMLFNKKKKEGFLDSNFLVELNEFINIEEVDIKKTGNSAEAVKTKMQEAFKEFETFDSIYGKMVFFKETISKKFNKEIMSPKNQAPHLALLVAFYKLFDFVRQDVNSLTKRHLDFYYRELLEQKQNNRIIKHTAMVSCIPNKGIEDETVLKGAPFDFDLGNGQKMPFNCDEETEINQVKIADIKTIFKSEIEPFNSHNSVDAFTYNMLYETDILHALAVKKEIQADNFKDFPLVFGGDRDRQCKIGFVISAPLLILEKGCQVLSIELKLDHDLFQEQATAAFDTLLEEKLEESLELGSAQNLLTPEQISAEKESLKDHILNTFFRHLFDIYITTENGWKVIEYSNTSHQDRIITIKIPLESRSDQMVAFDPLVHDGDYDTDWPCIRFLLNNQAPHHPYIFVKEWEIDYIRITTEVTEVTNMTLSNTNGNLDPTIPFAPFGATPEIGSFFRIQNPLILQRYLSSLELSINWNGLPLIEGGFDKYYEAYQLGIKNDSFKAFISQTRNLARNTSVYKHLEFNLFELDKGYLDHLKHITVDLNDFELNKELPTIANPEGDHEDSLYIMLRKPDIGFGHMVFPEVYAKTAMQNTRVFKKPLPLPRQPYIPVIDHLKVKYTNTAKESMLRKQDDKSAGIKLFHQHPFGYIKIFPGSVKSPCHLIPQIDYKGNLFIGIEEVNPNDILSIGFELIAAILNHTVLELPKISWMYLINNQWHDLSKYILVDNTIGLRKSGIVKIEVPQSIQTDQTVLPSGKFWIRASFGKEKENFSVEINTRVKRVFMQAVPLTSKHAIPSNTQTSDFTHKSVKINTTDAIKTEKVVGPMGLVLDEYMEDETAFYNRVSERLRHKGRGITNWDIERILLEKFQQIEKIRVYGRNSYPNELVLGSNIQIVVIPKNDFNDAGLFQPSELDVDTLEEIKKYAKRYMSDYARVEVCNPIFEKLKIRCRVSFNDEHKSTLLRHRLNKELVNFLSPNLKDFNSEDLFEKSFTKTGIFNFIASRNYVKKVFEFSVIQLVDVMNQYRIIDTEDGKDQNTRNKLQTISAYAILTSVDRHHIIIANSSGKDIKGIGDIAIGSDFIIADEEGNYID